MRLYLFIFLFLSFSVSASTLSPRTYNALIELQDKIGSQPNDEEAIDVEEDLIELAEDLKGNSLGLALTLQTHAQLKIYQNDTTAAESLLIKAVKIEGLDSSTLNQLRSMLGFQYYNSNQYRKAIAVLSEIIKTQEKPSANIYALVAASYYSLEQFKEGLPYIEKACELSDTPKEGWLQMAFAGNYQLKSYKKAAKFVNQLVYFFPENKDYWQQKAGLHQVMERYDLASATKEAAYKKEFIKTENDFVNLGQLLASQGEPYKVAIIIEKALKNNAIEPSEKTLNLLFQSWLQAKEINRAIDSLAKLYSSYEQTKHGYQLLQYYIDQQSWDLADKTASKLLSSDLTDEQKGKTFLYQGMAKYRMGEIDMAMRVLGKSTAFESSSSQAKSWMNYIKQMNS